MKRNFTFPLLSIFLCFCFIICPSCKSENNANAPVLKTCLNGEKLSFYDERTKEFLDTTNADDTAEFLKKYKGSTFNSHITYEISWTGENAPYKVIFSKDENFKNVYLQKNTNRTTLSLSANDYLLCGKYYYKVIDGKGKGSNIDSFETDSIVQSLDLKKVYNVRDLGGWKTKDNKTINYKKLFRGGKLEDAFDVDKSVFNELGIKTDLDLRGAAADDKNLSENGPSPIGLKNYYLTKINTYDDMFTYYDEMAPLYKKTFEVLCDESNYPIYFHCTWGADRTGTVAMLIEGLLGVSLDDIYKDYELTSFSGKVDARWRSNIVGEEGNYHFDDSGVQRNDVRFGLTIQKLLENYGNGTNDLQLAVKNYLLSIGITQFQLDNLIKILTE